MKKLPVLLLILTLASVWPTNPVEALGVKELPAENVYDSRFHIQSVEPREGEVRVELDILMEPNLKAQRLWLATVDYENGWTEAEVDARLENWDELGVEWTLVTKEQSLVGMFSHAYMTIILADDLTQVNLLDVLYYAVELEDSENEGTGPVWMRGKVDYRGCVHTERFERWETEVCVEVIDREAGTVKYLALDSTEEEEVITWEEEWRRVLAGRLSNMAAILDGLAMLPEVTEDDLMPQEESLAEIEKHLMKLAGAENELAEVTLLRGRIEALRCRKDESADEESGNNSGAGGDSGVEDDGGRLQGGGLEEEQGSSNSGDKVENKDTAIEGGKPGVGFAESADVAVVDYAATGDSSGVAEAAALEEKMDNELEEIEVEVPKLGGEKPRSGWVRWMILGLSGVLSLLFVAILKRKRSKK